MATEDCQGQVDQPGVNPVDTDIVTLTGRRTTRYLGAIVRDGCVYEMHEEALTEECTGEIWTRRVLTPMTFRAHQYYQERRCQA